jgi:hypothetical protein
MGMSRRARPRWRRSQSPSGAKVRAHRASARGLRGAGPAWLAHRIHKSKPSAVEATPGSVTERGCQDHLEKSRNSASVHDREI